MKTDNTNWTIELLYAQAQRAKLRWKIAQKKYREALKESARKSD